MERVAQSIDPADKLNAAQAKSPEAIARHRALHESRLSIIKLERVTVRRIDLELEVDQTSCNSPNTSFNRFLAVCNRRLMVPTGLRKESLIS